MKTDKPDDISLIQYLYQVKIQANHTLQDIEITQTEGTSDNEIRLDVSQAGDVCIALLEAAIELHRGPDDEMNQAAAQACRIDLRRRLADFFGIET